VDLLEVEKHILMLDEQFHLECFAYDEWQAAHLAATLEADTGHKRRNSRRIYGSLPWCRSVVPNAATLRTIASTMIESFQDGRLLLYPEPDLRYDLEHLRVEEKATGGFRLTSPRDSTGHGDLAASFSYALLIAAELSLKKPSILRALDLGDGWGSVSTADIGTVKTSSLSAWEMRQQEYQQEMQELSQGESQREETRRVMQQLFRRSPQRFF
jgi:hypothetical protein